MNKILRFNKNANVEYQIYLHTVKNLSTSQIANKLGMKKNTIIQNLRYHKKLKQSLGRDIEEKIAQWFEKNHIKIIRQKGDCSFDLLIFNQRINVKSAHFQKNEHQYKFAVVYKNTKYVDYHKEVDYFILVFLDEPGIPFYSLKSSEVNVTSGITIHNLFNTKYPLQFVGYLEEKGW
jgi:hypothetical protein